MRLITALTLCALLLSCEYNTNEEDGSDKAKSKTIIKVLIDPGHTKEMNYAKGAAGEEYLLNYKTAVKLKAILQQHSNIYSELSRGEEEYSKKVEETLARRSNEIRAIALADSPLEATRSTNAKQLHNRMMMYAVRQYAAENAFDVLLSIHFDSRWWKGGKTREEHGYHLIISPYRHNFQSAYSLARSIHTSMSNTYSISKELERYFEINSAHYTNARVNVNSAAFLSNAVCVRSLLMIGDVYEDDYYKGRGFSLLTPVSVLAECGYVYERRFAKDGEQQRLAERLAQGLTNWIYESYLKGKANADKADSKG